jgi:hypothetical protein
VVLTTNGGPAVLLANRGEGHGHWLQVDLQGTRSNRDGLGAMVEITVAGETRSWLVRAGGSYLSQSQISPLFGLGSEVRVGRLVVRWPSGAIQKVSVPGVDRRIQVVEPTD